MQARSVATRAALLDAALECLVADGYAAVTTTEIARRAGVSRGAQLHHFPTKAELMTAAVEHLLERRLHDFATTLASMSSGGDRLDHAIDVVWSMFEGPAFIAWVELWIAARSDAELAVTMVDVDLRFTAASQELAVELLSEIRPVDVDLFLRFRGFVFALMTGAAVQMLIPRGQRPVSEYLDLLKQMAHSMLELEASTP